MKSNFSRQMVLAIFAALISAWVWVNWPFLIHSQNGIISFFLTALLSALIIFRPKTQSPADGDSALSGRAVTFFAVTGTILIITGLSFNIRQLEWIGILSLTFSCLGFSLSAKHRTDITLAVLLLYAAHPIPSRLFQTFQMTMQQLSVSWSEWLLHVFNFRVFADGFALRHGLNLFEIPDYCSGMRTASTLFILTIGISILRRLSLLETAGFSAFGVLQALLLNVLRISIIVAAFPDAGSETAFKLLHDTSGIVTIAGILLIYAEISAYIIWKTARRASAELPASVDLIISEMPPVLRHLQNRRTIIIAAALLTLLSAGLIYKSRPSHRAEMIKSASEALRDSGELDESLKAARIADRFKPGDSEWSLHKIRLLVMMRRYDDAIGMINSLHGLSAANEREAKVLTAYCMLGTGKTNEAALMVNSIPENVRKVDSRTSMALAELSFYLNDPEGCALDIVTASKWQPNSPRIRALYPYLASNRKFSEIARSDSHAPFSDPDQLLAAAEAYMNLNMTDDSARLAQEAVKKWPEDLRIAELLYFHARLNPGSEWTGLFASQITRTAKITSDVSILYRHIDKCFTMGRPDLAWQLVSRIQTIEPDHPLLWLSLARFGDEWFLFRRLNIGLRSDSINDTIDIKNFYHLGTKLADWAPMCGLIPFGDELSTADTAPARKRFLAKAVTGFEKRDKEKPLSEIMLYEYITALEMSGESKKALAALSTADSLTAEPPSRKTEAISALYARNGDWEMVYETLKDEYTPENIELQKLNLASMLRFCESLGRLNLGPAALYASFQTQKAFPGSPQAAGNLVSMLARYDTPEAALFYAERHKTGRLRDLETIEAEALFLTQRYSELSSFCKRALLPQMLIPENAPQASSVMPAEAAALWHHMHLPSKADFDANAKAAAESASISRSPFIRALQALWLECYEAKCERGTADITRWLSAGRTSIEKATALNQLSMLLCHNGRLSEARDAAGQAVKHLPQSPLLWRMLISLSSGNADVIEASRRSCSADPEIWLAEIVFKTQRGTAGKSKWNEQAVIDFFGRQDSRPDDFNVEAAARIAEYLYRGKMDVAASIPARSAYRRARGWLPACLLGIRCAASDRDRQLALSATKNSISAAVNPTKEMYINLVSAKTSDRILDEDNDMINALRNLRQLDPDNETWAGILGLIRFKRGGGDMIDAYNQMSEAIRMGTTNVTPYIIAAEASRFLGSNDRTLDILRKGLERHPGNLILMNNLAYSTAKCGSKPSDAQKFIPELSRHTSNLTALDTVAFIYMRNGDRDSARSVLNSIIGLCSTGTQPWFRARMFIAEIALQEGKKTEAELILKDILRYSRNVHDEDLLYANSMMLQINGSNPPQKEPSKL